MVLKRIHSTFFTVVILFSVVHNLKIKRSSPDFTDIVKNISSVNSLLQNVIRNYKELEKIVKTDNEENDFRTDSEIKQLFEIETSKKLEDKITTKSNKLLGTPLYFSDESWRDGDSETNEKSENDKENYETAPIDSKEFTKAFAVKKKYAKERNFKDDAEPNGDKNSDVMKDQLEPREKTPRNKDHKKNIVVTKEASGNQSKLKKHSFKSKPQRVPQISQTTTVHDSDDGKVMINEVLRADYLRAAYMDACKMVTIRKCRRALRAVSKDVCSRGRKCTGEFNDDFRRNGLSACNTQFTNRSTACRSGVDYDETEVHFPGRRPLKSSVMIKTKQPRANSSKHARAIARTQQINFLRDRYEKACKKDSFKKCKAACKYSYKKTCKKFECPTVKSNAFKKSCKRRCKESFGVTDGDGDDSDDSGSSDGSDGSGSGS